MEKYILIQLDMLVEYMKCVIRRAYSKELTTYENVSLKAFLKSFNLKKILKKEMKVIKSRK